MDRYRSGHNGPDSKSGSPHGLVGSNPTLSATSPQAIYRLRRLFYKSHRRAHSAAPPFPKKVITRHLRCSLVNALATLRLATTFFGIRWFESHIRKRRKYLFRVPFKGEALKLFVSTIIAAYSLPPKSRFQLI